jgi:hypothetical protein
MREYRIKTSAGRLTKRIEDASSPGSRSAAEFWSGGDTILRIFFTEDGESKPFDITGLAAVTLYIKALVSGAAPAPSAPALLTAEGVVEPDGPTCTLSEFESGAKGGHYAFSFPGEAFSLPPGNYWAAFWGLFTDGTQGVLGAGTVTFTQDGVGTEQITTPQPTDGVDFSLIQNFPMESITTTAANLAAGQTSSAVANLQNELNNLPSTFLTFQIGQIQGGDDSLISNSDTINSAFNKIYSQLSGLKQGAIDMLVRNSLLYDFSISTQQPSQVVGNDTLLIALQKLQSQINANVKTRGNMATRSTNLDSAPIIISTSESGEETLQIRNVNGATTYPGEMRIIWNSTNYDGGATGATMQVTRLCSAEFDQCPAVETLQANTAGSGTNIQLDFGGQQTVTGERAEATFLIEVQSNKTLFRARVTLRPNPITTTGVYYSDARPIMFVAQNSPLTNEQFS